MSFQNIPKIENSAFYVNLAFKNAGEDVKSTRQKVSKQRSSLEKSKTIEIEKMRSIKIFLHNILNKMIKDFPSLDQCSDFYRELLKCYLDLDALRKSLGALNWASRKIEDFFIIYKGKIATTTQFKKINENRRMFYGRVSSAMKQINKNLKIIEQARKIIKEFPSIKDNMFTVAIAGFPNVGKSTLLSKISNSRPEIADYAFTTKSLNTGYIFKNGKKIVQLIDTPGTLNRFEKMNVIEQQAYLAMKYAAHMIVYVFDPTDTYPMKDQEKLLKNIKSELKKKVIIYISKTDLVETDMKGIKDFEELKEEVIKISED